MRMCWSIYSKGFVLANKNQLANRQGSVKKMDINEIRSVFSACGFLLDERKAYLFQHYLRILRQENEKYNLTRILDPQAILEEHFCDSLAGLSGRTKKDALLLDLGSGAGFPGVPIKIFLPEIKIYLLEAVRKKIIFLGKVVRVSWSLKELPYGSKGRRFWVVAMPGKVSPGLQLAP